jgi:sugar phosphate isomerase/epimerase
MKCAVTVSLVPEARGGPFIYWDGLEAACLAARGLGFDGVEVFPPSADAVDRALLRRLLADNGLSLAAVGTGAGWLRHRLSLTSPDGGIRERARAFVREVIGLAGEFGAPAIVGSMQGRHGEGWLPADEARTRLAEALSGLGEAAKAYGVPVLYEPLNRYETNLCVKMADAVALVGQLGNVEILADLFHLNIEEDNSAAALRHARRHLGHVHFVDSNRKAAGMAQTDFAPIAAVLKEIGYTRFLSAEAFPLPDAGSAASSTIETFRKHFR